MKSHFPKPQTFKPSKITTNTVTQQAVCSVQQVSFSQNQPPLGTLLI